MENDLVQARRAKLQAIKDAGKIPYPNDFVPTTDIGRFNQMYQDDPCPALDAPLYNIAGRIFLHRVMGKTSFAHIGDHTGRLQLYLKENVGEDIHHTPSDKYQAFKKFDLGDIVGVSGYPYRTQKGELSLRVVNIKLLTKNLHPLPDKHAGLSDIEMRYRQRYVDLIANPETISVFKARSKIVSAIRNFMEHHDFLEVETPMLHPIPGGANARPFTTHHNALDMELYLRIAPELYLKRLIVGGFTRVFEINRNFRNEGISPRHNPEFTMMEFYQAYANADTLMSFIQIMLNRVRQAIDPKATAWEIERISMAASISRVIPTLDVSDEQAMRNFALEISGYDASMNRGQVMALIFETHVERTLTAPTFVTDFPIEISPLARRSDTNPNFAERFELYINGQEVANGFSELNDPDEQAARFREQVAARQVSGDQEAMYYDEDYIAALTYGMPPTAGAGIGIDRLVAILLNQPSIKDVILFPTQRPVK